MKLFDTIQLSELNKNNKLLPPKKETVFHWSTFATVLSKSRPTTVLSKCPIQYKQCSTIHAMQYNTVTISYNEIQLSDDIIHWNTIRYSDSAIQRNTIQWQCRTTYNAIQHNTIEYNLMQYNALQRQYNAHTQKKQCDRMQCNKTQHNAIQNNTMQSNRKQFIISFQEIASSLTVRRKYETSSNTCTK